MEWSLENSKILVENVRMYPILYDGQPIYNNSAQLQKIWDKIAEVVGNGATGFLCKHRWQVLRTAYRNHVKLGYRVYPTGIASSLKFLAPFIRTKAELAEKKPPEQSLDYCIRLTQIVKKYPQLYFDVDCSENADAWQEVATRMGSQETPEHCTSCWSKLFHRYKYHVKRGYKMKPSGIEQHLTFLDTPMALREETSLDSTVKLVNLVRENPDLYQNAISSDQLKIWENVAEKMGNGATAQECEANWRNLRIAYTSCLQKGSEMRRIGIADHLDFLKPYLKLPRVESGLGAKKIRLDDEATMTKLRRDTAVAAVSSHKHLKCDREDEDLLFLFEFLQDMAQMNDAEKMSFKLSAMRLAETCRWSLSMLE